MILDINIKCCPHCHSPDIIFYENILIERFNNTLRRRLARLVRKTLSFSKSKFYFCKVIKLFIVHYNLEKLLSISAQHLDNVNGYQS